MEFYSRFTTRQPSIARGNDRGTSYRSAIFCTSNEQRKIAEDTIADVEASHLWPGKVVTEVAAASDFWEADLSGEFSSRLHLPLRPAQLETTTARRLARKQNPSLKPNEPPKLFADLCSRARFELGLAIPLCKGRCRLVGGLQETRHHRLPASRYVIAYATVPP